MAHDRLRKCCTVFGRIGVPCREGSAREWYKTNVQPRLRSEIQQFVDQQGVFDWPNEGRHRLALEGYITGCFGDREGHAGHIGLDLFVAAILVRVDQPGIVKTLQEFWLTILDRETGELIDRLEFRKD